MTDQPLGMFIIVRQHKKTNKLSYFHGNYWDLSRGKASREDYWGSGYGECLPMNSGDNVDQQLKMLELIDGRHSYSLAELILSPNETKKQIDSDTSGIKPS